MGVLGARESHMREILKRSLPLLPLAVLQQVGHLAVTVLLARWMEVKSFGAFATLYVLIEILIQPATVGLGQIFVRYGSRYYTDARNALLKGLHRFSLIMVVMMGSAVTLLLALVAIPLIKGTATHDGLPYLLAAVPLGALVQVEAAHLLATRHPELSMLTRQVLPEWCTVTTAFVILLSVKYATVHEALWAVLAGYLLTLAFQATKLNNLFPEVQPVYKRREWLAVALPLMVNASGTALITRLDVLFMRVIEDETAVALFFPTVVIAGLTMIPVNAIGTVCKPRLAAGGKRGGDDDAFRTEIHHMARALLLTNTVTVVVLALLGPWLLMLYGERHADTALPLLLIMLAGRMLAPFRVVANAILKLVGNPWYSTASFVFGSLTAIGAALMLHGSYGLEGLAMGFVIGFAAGIAMRLFFVRKSLGLPFSVVCGVRQA